MANITFSPEAKEDLKEARSYIEEESLDGNAARKLVMGILDRISMLSEFPMMGPKLSSIAEVEGDYRFLTCDTHIAFYRIEEGEVRIVRILHARRNFMAILFINPKEA